MARPPRPLDALEHELQAEKAHALGRVAARMERDLAALRAFDAEHGAMVDPRGRAERDDLVAAAAESVWFYVVQRESLGFTHHEEALSAYQVPTELRMRMGPRIHRSLSGSG